MAERQIMKTRIGLARGLLVCGVAAGAAVLSEPATAQETNAAQPGESDTTNEIVVNAQKRPERLSEVPVAVTAIGADELLASGAVTLRDLSASAPGLQIAGGIGSGSLTIRGITSGNDGNATVGLQINGAPIGPVAFGAAGGSYMPELDPSLLTQVEVLRGPQGTLYGSSTLGGIVNYVLKEPAFDKVEGSLLVEGLTTYRGESSGTVRATFNAPLVTEKAAIQVTGFGSDLGGFVDNPGAGLKNFNNRESFGGRIAIAAQLTPSLRVTLSDLYTKIESNQDLVVYNPATQRPLSDDLENNDAVLPIYNSKFNMVGLDIEADFGGVTLSTITSYQTLDSKNVVDFSAAQLGAIAVNFLPLFGGVTLPSPANPAVAVKLGTRKLTQELRLTSSDDGPFKWVLGFFYNDENSKNAQILSSYDQNSQPRVGNLSSLVRYDLLTNYTEYAGFANITYSLTSNLAVTGGVRVQAIDQDYRQLYSGSDAAALNALYVAFGLSPTPQDSGLSKVSDSVATYLANISYKFSPNVMAYARFATGFRPGGPNILVPGLPTTFEPDTTNDYELGVKANFWGGRGFIDVSLYNIDWKNIQIITFASGINGQTNGGSATSRGAEASIRLEPTAGLTLSGSIAYSDAKLNETIPGGLGNKGDRMPMNPKWSGSLSADFEWPMGSATGFVGTSANFVGKRYSGFQSSVIYAQYVLPSYMLVNLRGGVRVDNWELSMFVRNVGDERAQLGATTLASNLIAVQRPRTFGVSIGKRF
jgi:outer membrane receptor protein involved in Fe transport